MQFSEAMIGLAVLPAFIIFLLIIRNSKSKEMNIGKALKITMLSACTCAPAALLEFLGQSALIVIFWFFGVNILTAGWQEQVAFYSAYFFLVVGLVEECCKYFTFKLFIMKDRKFSNTYDGILYGAASALGFATFENLIYIVGRSDLPLLTAVMRAIMSIPIHTSTGVFMGYCFSVVKYREYNRREYTISRKQNPYKILIKKPETLALTISIVFHAIYDIAATCSGLTESVNIQYLCFLTVISITIIAYVSLTVFILLASKCSKNIYNEYYYNNLLGSFQDNFATTTTNPKELQSKISYLAYLDKSKKLNDTPHAFDWSLLDVYSGDKKDIDYTKRTEELARLKERRIAQFNKECIHCGREITENANFCSFCGTLVLKDFMTNDIIIDETETETAEEKETTDEAEKETTDEAGTETAEEKETIDEAETIEETSNTSNEILEALKEVRETLSEVEIYNQDAGGDIYG